MCDFESRPLDPVLAVRPYFPQGFGGTFCKEPNSDGSDPRIGPGSARDRPFLKGLGSNFREGPKLGIGSGSMSRIEGPEGP